MYNIQIVSTLIKIKTFGEKLKFVYNFQKIFFYRQKYLVS